MMFEEYIDGTTKSKFVLRNGYVIPESYRTNKTVLEWLGTSKEMRIPMYIELKEDQKISDRAWAEASEFGAMSSEEQYPILMDGYRQYVANRLRRIREQQLNKQMVQF